MSSLVKTSSGSQYTDEQRRSVIATYAVLGNQHRVSEQEGVPQKTISDWVNSEWGQELLTQIRLHNQDEFIAGYTRIVRANLTAQEDRLVYGEVSIGKDGSHVRTPVKYRDLVVGGGIAVDKIRLLSNQATSITATDGTLTNIAKQLAAYAVDKQEEKVIQGSVVHDKDVT